MKKITKGDKEAIDICLAFIVKELQKRAINVIADRSMENLDFLDKGIHAYQCTRTLAYQIGVDTREHDEKVDRLRTELRRYDIKM
jgi:hypothetical protein